MDSSFFLVFCAATALTIFLRTAAGEPIAARYPDIWNLNTRVCDDCWFFCRHLTLLPACFVQVCSAPQHQQGGNMKFPFNSMRALSVAVALLGCGVQGGALAAGLAQGPSRIEAAGQEEGV
jgi:hypothetical protein